jgi:diguanylate cyclase (GGDEF)-like protein
VGGSYLASFVARLGEGRGELEEALQDVLTGRCASRDVDVAGDAVARDRWLGARVTSVHGADGGAVVVHSDITDRRRTQDDFEYRATHDPLTGLLNRAALEAGLDDALADLAGGGPDVAVLFVDLDGFKAVNDSFGHGVGDDVLRAVAARLRRATRQTDRIARFGGDEFIVVLDLARPTDGSPVEHTAERILRAMDDPIRVGSHVLRIGASVGIAGCTAGETRKQVLHRADHAMYIAKQAGGGRFLIGDDSLQAFVAPASSARGAPPAGNGTGGGFALGGEIAGGATR